MHLRRSDALQIVVVGSLAGLAYLLLLAAAKLSDVGLDGAVSDPYEATGHRMVGMVSNAGLLIWASTTAICIFTVAVLRRSQQAGPWRRLFLAAAVVFGMFLVDDLLAVHEGIADPIARLLDVEVTDTLQRAFEGSTLAVIGVAVLAYLWTFRALLRQGNLGALVLGLGMLGLSAVVDLAVTKVLDGERMEDALLLLEEGAKLVGIALLGLFQIGLARDRLADLGDHDRAGTSTSSPSIPT